MTPESRGTTAVFGGTFDPPHKGHAVLAEAVLEAGLASSVLFVPAAAPPHKPSNAVAAFEQRGEMLALALAGMRHVSISDLERRRLPEPSYTIVTMTELQRERPGERLVLLIGADSLLTLHTWREARELVDRWRVIAYPRRGHCVREQELMAHWPAETASRLGRSVADLPTFDASSTDIRHRLAAGESVEGLLRKEVWDYIVSKGLYR